MKHGVNTHDHAGDRGADQGGGLAPGASGVGDAGAFGCARADGLAVAFGVYRGVNQSADCFRNVWRVGLLLAPAVYPLQPACGHDQMQAFALRFPVQLCGHWACF